MGPHGAFGFGSAREWDGGGGLKWLRLAKLEASLKKPQAFAHCGFRVRKLIVYKMRPSPGALS
jgi:hypothetical protein